MLIISVVYNQPKFVEYQYRSLKKFMDAPFTYKIYCNSDNENMKDQFLNISKELDIECICIPQNIHKSNDVCHRAGKSLNYAIIDVFKNNPSEKLLILDSDMFLIDNFNKRYENFDFSGIYWKLGHIEYYTNQLLYLDFRKISNVEQLDFVPCVIDRIQTDCGGKLYHYFKDKQDIKIHKIKCFPENVFEGVSANKNVVTKDNIDTVPIIIKSLFEEEIELFGGTSISEIYDDFIIHMRSGSNWMKFDNNIVNQRHKIFFKYLESLI